MVKNMATALREVRDAWVRDGRPGNLSTYVQDAMHGSEIELRGGVVITVASVANAGMAGLQVSGYAADGAHRSNTER